MAGRLSEVKVKEKRKYRKKSEQKIIKKKGVFFCIEDEGDGTGKCRTEYKNMIKGKVHSHQAHVHYNKEAQKAYNRKLGRKRLAENSLTSYLSHKKEQGLLPLFPIQEYNSDSDWEDDVPLQFLIDRKTIDAAEKKKYAKHNASYNASFFVSYVPEKPDIGPEATYEKRNKELKRLKKKAVQKLSKEETAKYTFSLYYGTSHAQKLTCGYLNGSSLSSGGAKLLKLMKDGQVCHRQDFTFSGRTADENRDDAMDWQHFYKHVKLEKEFVPQDQTKVIFDILNGGLKGGLQRKNSYKRVLSDDVKGKAKKIGWQNRPLIPLSPDLLQQDPEDVP